MERDEVLSIWRESEEGEKAEPFAARIERFAALVAAAAADRARQDYEREHCRHVVPLPDALRVMIDEAVAAERESCAKVCEAAEDTGNDSGIERDVYIWNRAAKYCAAKVRARGAA